MKVQAVPAFYEHLHVVFRVHVGFSTFFLSRTNGILADFRVKTEFRRIFSVGISWREKHVFFGRS